MVSRAAARVACGPTSEAEEAAAKASPAELLRQALREAGLRATAPRLAVLRSLNGATGPVSHGEVAADLAAEGWDRATVYRNLMALTSAGLLRRTNLGDHTWRFELKRGEPGHDHAGKQPEDTSVHPHFLCDACGDVVCLLGSAVQVVAARGTPKAIQRRRYEVQIKGRCDNCD
jgi:Fur family ferric uptake transcriptional regulator